VLLAHKTAILEVGGGVCGGGGEGGLGVGRERGGAVLVSECEGWQEGGAA
jgi:hypothetical protein